MINEPPFRPPEAPHAQPAHASRSGTGFASSAVRISASVGRATSTEQSCRGHDDPARAIPALGHLLGDEGGLEWMGRLGRSQALKRRDRPALDVTDRHLARANGAPVQQHRASAALPQPATELRGVQAERIAKKVKKRLVRVRRLDRSGMAIHGDICSGASTPSVVGEPECSKSRMRQVTRAG